MALAMAHSDELQLQLCPVSSRFCYYFYITCENNNRAAGRERRSNGQINTPKSDSWINTSVKVQIVRAAAAWWCWWWAVGGKKWTTTTPRIHMSPVVIRYAPLPHLYICNCPRVYLCLCWDNNGTNGNKELGTWYWLSSRFRSESFVCCQVLLLLLYCFLSGNFHWPETEIKCISLCKLSSQRRWWSPFTTYQHDSRRLGKWQANVKNVSDVETFEWETCMYKQDN